MRRWNFTFAESSICARARRLWSGKAPEFEIALKRVDYPAAIRDLIGQLKRMPGIGPRSAERIALWLVQSRDARPKEIAAILNHTAESVRPCPKCGFFTVDDICGI